MDLAAYFATRDGSQDRPDLMPVLIKGATRADLPAYLAARGAKVGAEVGVFKGEFAELLCQGIPGLHLYCVDRWAPYRVENADGSTQTIFKRSEDAYAEAKQRLAPYDCEFLRMSSVEGAAAIQDGSLDFIFVDADHRWQAVLADLAAWIPKVKPGGIIAGHDYEDTYNVYNGVCIITAAWTRARGILPWYVLGRSRVRPGEAWERHRSYVWEQR